MSKQIRRKFSEEFKQDTVSLIERESYGFSEASARLGISESVLRRWHKRYGSQSQELIHSPEKSEDILAENRRLKQEVRRLQMERDILKKATAFFAKESL